LLYCPQKQNDVPVPHPYASYGLLVVGRGGAEGSGKLVEVVEVGSMKTQACHVTSTNEPSQKPTRSVGETVSAKAPSVAPPLTLPMVELHVFVDGS
jgi:hypothetical protein